MIEVASNWTVGSNISDLVSNCVVVVSVFENEESGHFDSFHSVSIFQWYGWTANQYSTLHLGANFCW